MFYFTSHDTKPVKLYLSCSDCADGSYMTQCQAFKSSNIKKQIWKLKLVIYCRVWLYDSWMVCLSCICVKKGLINRWKGAAASSWQEFRGNTKIQILFWEVLDLFGFLLLWVGKILNIWVQASICDETHSNVSRLPFTSWFGPRFMSRQLIKF